MNFKTGTAMRVVDFTPQYWSVEDEDQGCDRSERTLLGCYLGKIGYVRNIYNSHMPILLKFEQEAKVPISEMRFHENEVEAAG